MRAFFLAAACGAALAAAALAAAGPPGRATFDVWLAAEIVDSSPELHTTTADGCTESRRPGLYFGVRLRSTRPTRVSVVRRGGRIVYLPPAIDSVTASSIIGATPWETIRRCPGEEPQRSFIICKCGRTPEPGLTARLAPGPRNTLGLRAVTSTFFRGELIPGHPVSNVDRAGGTVAPKRLFDRRVRRVVVRGEYVSTAPISGGGSEAELTRRVRWTLTLVRRTR